LENVIFKYPLAETRQLIPAGKPLHVGFQQGELFIWVQHLNPPVGKMKIDVIATGEEFMPELLDYIGTAISDTSLFVWHVFEHKVP